MNDVRRVVAERAPRRQPRWIIRRSRRRQLHIPEDLQGQVDATGLRSRHE